VKWKGTPLSKLRIKAGEWEHSQRFAEITAAYEWKLTPSEFWALPEEDQAYMLAYLQTKNKIAAHEAQLQEARLRRAGRRKNRTNRNQ